MNRSRSLFTFIVGIAFVFAFVAGSVPQRVVPQLAPATAFAAGAPCTRTMYAPVVSGGNIVAQMHISCSGTYYFDLQVQLQRQTALGWTTLSYYSWSGNIGTAGLTIYTYHACGFGSNVYRSAGWWSWLWAADTGWSGNATLPCGA